VGRRKQQALDVPETAEEARAIMADYIQAERSILGARLDAEIAIDAVTVRRDGIVAGLATANATRFAQLKAWWEAGGQKLLADKGARSGQLAGAKIGIRLTPPKVKFAKGEKAEKVVLWLSGLRSMLAGKFIRRKLELDKQEIVKRLPSDESVQKLFAGKLSVIQVDEFFIDAGLDEDAMRSALAAAQADE
jgi:phage host-nuclease inhibitor protein Gam